MKDSRILQCVSLTFTGGLGSSPLSIRLAISFKHTNQLVIRITREINPGTNRISSINLLYKDLELTIRRT